MPTRRAGGTGANYSGHGEAPSTATPARSLWRRRLMQDRRPRVRLVRVVPGRSVESDVYERLYGRSETAWRGRRRASEERQVLVDTALLPAPELEPTESPATPRRSQPPIVLPAAGAGFVLGVALLLLLGSDGGSESRSGAVVPAPPPRQHLSSNERSHHRPHRKRRASRKRRAAIGTGAGSPRPLTASVPPAPARHPSARRDSKRAQPKKRPRPHDPSPPRRSPTSPTTTPPPPPSGGEAAPPTTQPAPPTDTAPPPPTAPDDPER